MHSHDNTPQQGKFSSRAQTQSTKLFSVTLLLYIIFFLLTTKLPWAIFSHQNVEKSYHFFIHIVYHDQDIFPKKK